MNYYLCNLLYIGDRSDPKAIPDEVGAQCVIESEDDLTEVDPKLLSRHYDIEELLEDNDCDEIEIADELDNEDLEVYDDLDFVHINLRDL